MEVPRKSFAAGAQTEALPGAQGASKASAKLGSRSIAKTRESALKFLYLGFGL
jgi:hypothetical protein